MSAAPRGGPHRIAVVGGGISGLAAAHRLHELARASSVDLHVDLFEERDRIGGVISTLRRDGFLVEEGPDSLITEKPRGQRLAERIGLGGRLIGTRQENRRSFVVRRGRLEPTPDGFYLLAPSRLMPFATSRIFSPMGKLRMAMDLFLPRGDAQRDESVAGFVTRRLGREALERIAQPMIAGIYGADPEKLSLRATFPRFMKLEEEHGSIIRGMLAAGRKRAAAASSRPVNDEASGARYGLFVSFDEGLQVLTDALAARLPSSGLRTGLRVTRLAPAPSGGWTLETAGRSEERLLFDAVIVALHAPDAADLVRGFDPPLAERLASIHYGTAATVSLAFADHQVGHPMDGFGFVVPAIEGLSVLGCTFSQRKYARRAPEGHALLRAFWGDASARLSDEEVTRRTLDEIRLLLGTKGDPLFTHVARWPRSMPHYHVGHLDLVDEIERLCGTHPGLAMAGNAYRGLGVPDCVSSGEMAAESILAQIRSVQTPPERLSAPR